MTAPAPPPRRILTDRRIPACESGQNPTLSHQAVITPLPARDAAVPFAHETCDHPVNTGLHNAR
ncbi:hypothetical protein GCM10010342_11150 [Streptomyces anulatus]|nr:hypothetical protein GCM10010342_11150 [Streptomyces anulatus]